jgi:hypothetical protein
MTVKSKKKAGELDAQTQKGGAQPVGEAQAPCMLAPDPTLLVKVLCTDGATKTIRAKVEAVGPKTSASVTGIADYGTVKPGTYTVKVTALLAPDDKDYVIGAGASVEITLAKGDQRVLELLVEKKNIVTPKLEVEYKVVLLDPKLSAHQEAAEPEKFVADVTYVEVSISETNKAHPYTKGAKFSCTPANVDVFLDVACTQKLTGNLTNVQLPVDTVLKLYLKGTTAGKFKAKLELLDPADGAIRIEKEVIEAMGVVELQMELHEQNLPKIDKLSADPDVNDIKTYHSKLKSLTIPKQIVMSDADKVKKGRWLHAQDGENHARARLVIKKYSKKHWPDGTDAYEIVLTNTADSGALALHSAEWKDAPVAAPKFTVKDLKAKDHEYWVQGSSASDKPISIRLDLGLDRAAGGLAKTPKRNGDWARFTVVKIDDVKVDYTAPASGVVAWNTAEKRFYINLQADPAGRKVTIGAKLSQKIAGVEIHFMLAPHKDNRKKAGWGENMPGTWSCQKLAADLKSTDKAKRKDYLHLSAKTDADGYAKAELTLSRFGGDVFHHGAYIEHDPHLAKYVHGHADLEKKKPVLGADGPIAVWRKVWYQESKPAGLAVPVAQATVDAYKAVFADVELDATVEFDSGSAPARTFYPEYMLKTGSAATTPTANIGSYNKTALSALLVTKASQPIKRHLMVCLYQCDPSGTDIARSAKIVSDQSGQWIDIVVSSDYIVEPAMAGGSMIVQLYWFRQSDPGTQHPIGAGEARIPQPRAGRGQIQVKVPAIAPAPTAADGVFIVAECQKATGYLGESFAVRHTLAVYDSSDQADFFDTITHEFGHSFNQTPRPGAQPASVPKHPDQKDRGQGNHCQVNIGKDAPSKETKYTCVMYDSGPMKWGLHKFCAKCHPYLQVEDFHKP